MVRMMKADGLSFFCIVVLVAMAQGTLGGRVTTLTAATPKAVDCQTCKTFMTEAKQVLETSVGTKFDVALFGYFCKEDMGAFSNFCKQLVKTFFEKTREFVLLLLAPTTFCPALKFCTADSGSLLSGPDVTGDVSLSVPSKCDNCKEFFGEVVKRLQDPAYEQPVVDALKTVCVAGCATAKICIEAANEYGKSLLQTLGTAIQNLDFCKQTGSCPPADKGADDVGQYEDFFDLLSQHQNSFGILDLMKNDPSRSSKTWSYGHQSVLEPVKASSDCDSCRWYMYDYQGYLATEVGDQLIFKVTTDVCKTDTGVFTGLCEAVVKNFRDYLLQVILEETKPSLLCPLFGFCASSSSNQPDEVPPTSPVPVGYKASCDDCKVFFTKMQAAWKDSTMQLKLIAKFRARCTEFCAFETSCHAFYDIYARSMMTTIADEAVDPLKTCTTLKNCPEKKSNSENRPMNKEIPPMKSAEGKFNSPSLALCKSCLVTATKMQVALLNATKGDTSGVLTKFCSLLPDSLRTECHSLTARLAPIISQQGPRVFKPGKICQMLSACNADNPLQQGPFAKMLNNKPSVNGL